MAGLVLAGDTLYCTTDATIFAISTNGTNFRVLRGPLNGGTLPVGGWARLILIGSTLYGTTRATEQGSGDGTVFKINADGSGYAVLYAFTGGSDGAIPSAGLVASGNTLFGTASQGGVGNGTVFALNTDGTGFTVLHQFSGNDGSDPEADLVLSSNRLYGTTSGGGSRGDGTVFAINVDGTAFETLHSFGSTTEDGVYPVCVLTLSANTLYGTTQGGGSSGSGTIFRITTDGKEYGTIYNFSSLKFVNIDLSTNADGAVPRAGLVLFENALYGTASTGGTFGAGTVFSVYLLPQLTITPFGANVIVAWSTNFTGFRLQSTTNMSSPVWTTNLPAHVMVNGQFAVTNSVSGTQQFFRLSQ